MAPHAETEPLTNVNNLNNNDNDEDLSSLARLPPPPPPPTSKNPPRILIIGAGSRGNAYARATAQSTNGIVVAVAEPIPYKRRRLGQRWIWGARARRGDRLGKGEESEGRGKAETKKETEKETDEDDGGDEGQPAEGQSFADWREFVAYELQRRARVAAAEPDVPPGVDAVFVCVLDEQHKEVIVGLAPLGLHVMCEKPLATRLADCVEIYRAMVTDGGAGAPEQRAIFSIGHVLRYSPHNMLLRKLLLEDRVIGEVLSVNHTEPVGWWHFTHSYVRGNWRKQSNTAPTLLTKSCHDIDLLLWLLCSPPPNTTHPPHLPSTITSSGARQFFTKTRKPTAAGTATNCLSCPIEPTCNYSASRIYLGPELGGLGAGNTNWPVDIVLPEIEECIARGGLDAGHHALRQKLAEDYDDSTPLADVDARNWFGRCVYEADNDVCDDQTVTLTWDEAPLPLPSSPSSLSPPPPSSSSSPSSSSRPTQPAALLNRGAKTATLHMVSHTQAICERYSRIYGTDGELEADSSLIHVTAFPSGKRTTYAPHVDASSGHGGGDAGLARHFVLAVDKVKNEGWPVARAQRDLVGCDLDEILRSHAVVFAAERARTHRLVVPFQQWWAHVLSGKET